MLIEVGTFINANISVGEAFPNGYSEKMDFTRLIPIKGKVLYDNGYFGYGSYGFYVDPAKVEGKFKHNCKIIVGDKVVGNMQRLTPGPHKDGSRYYFSLSPWEFSTPEKPITYIHGLFEFDTDIKRGLCKLLVRLVEIEKRQLKDNGTY